MHSWIAVHKLWLRLPTGADNKVIREVTPGYGNTHCLLIKQIEAIYIWLYLYNNGTKCMILIVPLQGMCRKTVVYCKKWSTNPVAFKQKDLQSADSKHLLAWQYWPKVTWRKAIGGTRINISKDDWIKSKATIEYAIWSDVWVELCYWPDRSVSYFLIDFPHNLTKIPYNTIVAAVV